MRLIAKSKHESLFLFAFYVLLCEVASGSWTTILLLTISSLLLLIMSLDVPMSFIVKEIEWDTLVKEE